MTGSPANARALISLPPGIYDPDRRWLAGPAGGCYLTPQTHSILMALARARGRPVTHGYVFQTLWPNPADEPGDPHNVLKVQVAKLRTKLAACGVDRRTISVRHHVGYYLAPANGG